MTYIIQQLYVGIGDDDDLPTDQYYGGDEPAGVTAIRARWVPVEDALRYDSREVAEETARRLGGIYARACGYDAEVVEAPAEPSEPAAEPPAPTDDDTDRALALRVARDLGLDDIERRCARALSRFSATHPTARAELAALLGGVDSVRRWLQVEPGEAPAPPARFFSFDSDNGYSEHDTAEQARAEAERALDWHRDQARYEDGWSEDVTSVCWGEIREQVIETDRGETDGDEEEGIEPETWADYALMPVADGRERAP